MEKTNEEQMRIYKTKPGGQVKFIGPSLHLAEAIKEFQAKGYKENLTPSYDHFYFGPDKIEIYPHEIFFDEILRFEELSAPDDQSILYAISAPGKKIKGLYVESYGLDHDDLSRSMIERMKFCHDAKRGVFNY
jgi:hypothetical protein